MRESQLDETRYYVTSLRTGAKALLRHVRQRLPIENSWHWVRDTQLREDAHRYQEINGVQIKATLRSMTINSLRLDGIWSVAEGIAALVHDFKRPAQIAGVEGASVSRAIRSLLIGPGPWGLQVAVCEYPEGLSATIGSALTLIRRYIYPLKCYAHKVTLCIIYGHRKRKCLTLRFTSAKA